LRVSLAIRLAVQCRISPGVIHMSSALKLVLCSSQTEDHVSLHKILDHSPWNVHGVFTAGDGMRLLRADPAVSAVLCEQDLPDGDWRSLLRETDGLPERPVFIVCARLADDRLWAEALNLGAFDVLLSAPFVAEEVVHAMESAWLAWNRTHGPWVDCAASA
jgi:DNA-binding NtrC family response regulator